MRAIIEAGRDKGTRDSGYDSSAPPSPGLPASPSPGILAAIFAATVLAVAWAVGFSGDFPLADDWAYAHAARSLCEQGELRLLPWTGASLVFQAAYGAMLCGLLGPSFVVLRISTFLLAASAVLGLYLLLRRIGVGRTGSALGAAVLGLDPVFLNLSFTYMTDVPFTAAAVWAGYLFVRGLGTGDRATLLVAALVCAAGALIRQHGIFIAGAAGLTALLVRGPLLPRLVNAAICTVPSLAALALYQLWLVTSHGLPPAMENKISEAIGIGPLSVGNAAFRAWATMGLLLAPAAVAMMPPRGSRARLAAAAASVVAAACALFLYVREGDTMFYLTHVLHDFSVGTLSLRDVHFLGLPLQPQLGAWLAVPLTLVACAGAALLAGAWIETGLRARRLDDAQRFCLLALVLLVAGSLLQAHYYFDRYLLPILPFALAAAFASHPGVRPRAASWVVLGVIGWFGVAGTHDYMAWNRARYAALFDLEAQGVRPTEIDGGMEYNGWRLAASSNDWPSDAEARVGQPAERKSWWWVVDDRFVVSFRALEGYRVRREYAYSRWLVPDTASVLLLERQNKGDSPL